MAGTDQQKTGGKEKRLANLTNAGKGRPKGVPNKTTVIAKQAIAAAFEKLGGTDRLVEWCHEDEKNEAAFWTTIYPKLLPLQLTGEDGGPIKVTRIELVGVKPE